MKSYNPNTHAYVHLGIETILVAVIILLAFFTVERQQTNVFYQGVLESVLPACAYEVKEDAGYWAEEGMFCLLRSAQAVKAVCVAGAGELYCR